jgi:hypothetical protein
MMTSWHVGGDRPKEGQVSGAFRVAHIVEVRPRLTRSLAAIPRAAPAGAPQLRLEVPKW